MINPDKLDILTQSCYTLGRIEYKIEKRDLQVLVNLADAFKAEILEEPTSPVQSATGSVMSENWPPKLLNTEEQEPETVPAAEEHETYDPDHGFVESTPYIEAEPADDEPVGTETVAAVRPTPGPEAAIEESIGTPAPETHKHCAMCKTQKPIDEFRVNRGKPYSWCRSCEREYQRQRAQQRKTTAAAPAPEPVQQEQPEPLNLDRDPGPEVAETIYVDRDNATWYIDELVGDGAQCYTLWKHKKPNDPMCLASLLDDYSKDGTFPTREQAQAALDQFARTQRQWRRCRRREPAQQTA